MKMSWAKDTMGFYFLPFVAYSNTPKDGKCVWFGIGYWLWSWELRAPAQSE